MSILQSALSPFVRDYWIGRTYMHRRATSPPPDALQTAAKIDIGPVDDEDIEAIRSSRDSEMRRRGIGPGPDIRQFRARMNGQVAALCTFGFGNSYVRSNGFYNLHEDEAELTDVFTCSEYRGLGLARRLIRFSGYRMHDEGFGTLYAKVWHSNRSSSQAFRAAGWHEFCFFIRLRPRGTNRIWHMEWRDQ